MSKHVSHSLPLPGLASGRIKFVEIAPKQEKTFKPYLLFTISILQKMYKKISNVALDRAWSMFKVDLVI